MARQPRGGHDASPPLRIIAAPDKFKGSLTAPAAARAIAEGVRRTHPLARVVELPVADGGDGTVAAFLAAGFRALDATVTGPDGSPRTTVIARSGDRAIVECASTAGLSMLDAGSLMPMTATSRGVGDAIVAALDDGARDIIIGLGGTACTDGGAGMLQALGVSITDANGDDVKPGGSGLRDAVRVIASGIDPRVRDATITLATDVDNPLVGEHGAAHVFGAQKGADARQRIELDSVLSHFASIVAPDLATMPAAGAAGGIAFGAMAVCGAKAHSGIDLVLDLLEFDRHVREADLVITGEGSLDDQSAGGKAPVGVLRAARRAGVPTIAVCGADTLGPRAVGFGFRSVHAITELEPDTERAMQYAAELLARLASNIDLARVSR